MARWADVEAAAPEFAQAVRALSDARRHKVLATLRKDGSPRLSGIELTFSDGDAWFGSMPGSRKSADLARDPRLALHITSADPEEESNAWAGDAKLSGKAEVVDDPARLQSMGDPDAAPEDAPEMDPGTLYRIDISEVVLTRLSDPVEFLVIESWTPQRGYKRTERL